jgi:hypothetical protein
MTAAVTNCKLLLLCSAGIAAQTAAVMMLLEKPRRIARNLSRQIVLIYSNRGQGASDKRKKTKHLHQESNDPFDEFVEFSKPLRLEREQVMAP